MVKSGKFHNLSNIQTNKSRFLNYAIDVPPIFLSFDLTHLHLPSISISKTFSLLFFLHETAWFRNDSGFDALVAGADFTFRLQHIEINSKVSAVAMNRFFLCSCNSWFLFRIFHHHGSFFGHLAHQSLKLQIMITFCVISDLLCRPQSVPLFSPTIYNKKTKWKHFVYESAARSVMDDLGRLRASVFFEESH